MPNLLITPTAKRLLSNPRAMLTPFLGRGDEALGQQGRAPASSAPLIPLVATATADPPAAPASEQSPRQIAGTLTDLGMTARGVRTRAASDFNFTPEQMDSFARDIGIAGTYTGPTSTRGMSPSQMAAFEGAHRQAISDRVAQLEAATAAIRDLRNARRAAQGLPEVGVRREGGHIVPNTKADEWNAKFEENNRLYEGKRAGLKGTALVQYVLGGRTGNTNVSSKPSVNDMISLAKLEHSLRSGNWRQQQDMLANQLALAREERQRQQDMFGNSLALSRNEREQQEAEMRRQAAFNAMSDTFVPQLESEFPWLTGYGQGLFTAMSRVQGLHPEQVPGLVAQAMEQMRGITSEGAFRYGNQQFNDSEVVEVLEGRNPRQLPRANLPDLRNKAAQYVMRRIFESFDAP